MLYGDFRFQKLHVTFLEDLLVVIVTVSKSHDFLKHYLGKKTFAQPGGVKVGVMLLSTSAPYQVKQFIQFIPVSTGRDLLTSAAYAACCVLCASIRPFSALENSTRPHTHTPGVLLLRCVWYTIVCFSCAGIYWGFQCT